MSEFNVTDEEYQQYAMASVRAVADQLMQFRDARIKAGDPLSNQDMCTMVASICTSLIMSEAAALEGDRKHMLVDFFIDWIEKMAHLALEMPGALVAFD